MNPLILYMPDFEKQLDLILGIAPAGTLKGDRAQQIKDLFRTEINAALEGVEKKIRNKPARKRSEASGPYLEGIADGYNHALSDVLSLIQSLKV